MDEGAIKSERLTPAQYCNIRYHAAINGKILQTVWPALGVNSSLILTRVSDLLFLGVTFYPDHILDLVVDQTTELSALLNDFLSHLF